MNDSSNIDSACRNLVVAVCEKRSTVGPVRPIFDDQFVFDTCCTSPHSSSHLCDMVFRDYYSTVWKQI